MSSRIQVGDTVAGKYRIDEILEGGGMGIVAKATHLNLRRPVAIKILHRDLAELPDTVERFRREARALAMLQSEHAVKVLDVDELPEGIPYMVLEYLEGQDLDRVLEERGYLPVTEAVGYVLQACDAIAESHLHGIVHRDIKPANLFLTHGPNGAPLVKVIDFGVARAKALASEAPDSELSLTTAGSTVGSPLYMAPEQLRGERVDLRADIWALGITLYELLAGQTPFESAEQPFTPARVLRTPPTPLHLVRNDVPEALENVIRRALEKEREHRQPSVEAFAEGIEPFGP